MEMDPLWEMERRFWLDGPDVYAARMARDAVMVFPPPAGIIVGESIVAGLKEAPRWRSVEISERAAVARGDTAVLAYRAEARRDGQAPYAALCSSTYARVQNGWLLLSHHQSAL